MQNTSIIYHMESLLEMQFMCLVTFAFVLKPEVNLDHFDEDIHRKSDHVMIVMVFEHIFAYCSHLFRVWEIENYGMVDINGVSRAKKESALKTLEVFIDCLIFGFTFNHFFSMTYEQFQAHPYVHFWIITDFTVMFLTLGFVYMTRLMIINSELTKNIYSLHFL